MTIIEKLSNKALQDEYFNELFLKAELNQALGFFQLSKQPFNEKELLDLLRFGDILSRSENSDSQNKAYKIVSLLIEDHVDEGLFQYFASSILTKLGNFPAIKFLEEHGDSPKGMPFELLFEKAIKEVYQKVPNSPFIFTDSQYDIFEDLKNHNHYSFSGPTSLGKSFIINAFIRYLIKENNGRDNIIILVPTRALINQTVLKLKEDFKDISNYKILAHPTVPKFYRNESSKYIFAFTPERLVAYLSEPDNPKIDYLFIDEAQKIISEKDSRSPLYYHSILQAERKSIKLYFASPNIPNPEIFLQLFEKNTDEKLSVRNSPVSQNRFFLDLILGKCILLSDNGEEQSIPIEFNNFDFDYWLKKLSGEDKSIVYCNTIEDTINYALEFAAKLPNKEDERINEVIGVIEDYLHKKYFLIECLRKGIAFHFGSLPQRIREKVEWLFREKALDFIFCTSTLLEGVNLPAKNIFILSNAIGLTKFTDIDFWNLAGRAGRLTKELSGNIICTRVEEKKNRWDNPVKDLSVVKNKEIKPVDPVVIKGQKSFYKNLEMSLVGKEFTNKSASNDQQNVWHQYANIAFLHELRSDDSVLRSNFIKKNENAKKILVSQVKKNVVPDKILSTSTTIKPKYQNEIYQNQNLQNEILPNNTDHKTVHHFLKLLSVAYRWDIEESGGRNPMYKSEKSLAYYATIMNNWINSTPLNLMITNAIKWYDEQGFYIDSSNQEHPFDKNNPYDINFAINELIRNIDNILRFKFKNYFENYYLLSQHRLGKENAGTNWAEYLEYGTTDYQVIELQNLGIPRHLAMFVLKNHSDCLRFIHKELISFDIDKLLEGVSRKLPEYEELREILEFYLEDNKNTNNS